jgi:hypothetical protein
MRFAGTLCVPNVEPFLSLCPFARPTKVALDETLAIAIDRCKHKSVYSARRKRA